ncbi:alpha/beta hydrolase [Streptomyces sp. A5-4]|uniref:alpha/beta hydrolase n=1 Tax=Streptomyces sp. A5-4 TaxID=3384771 RepID=UPI003DAA0C22
MRRFKRTLVAVAVAVTVVSGTAGWVTGNAQVAVTGAPPGAAAWRAEGLPDPVTSGPGQVARFFAGLSEARRTDLARRHPAVVGNLDGAPVALRYAANSRSLKADGRLALAAPGRQILAFDPRGRGQIAEVYGDLGAAEHVAVVVPGSDIDAGTFDRKSDVYGTPAGMAGALHRATGRRAAVIAWAGYTTPVGVGVDAASGALAEAGAVRLGRLADGLDATGSPDPVVFCHSYGSVVCGLAAPRLDASDVVVLGSPGMRVSSVDELDTRARVWAAKDPDDWISKVPHVEFAGLGHGADPAEPSFGARRVPAEDAQGHTGYFAPGTESLRTFAAIAEGEL